MVSSRYLAGNSSLLCPHGRSQRRLARHGRLAVLIGICNCTKVIDRCSLDGLRMFVGSFLPRYLPGPRLVPPLQYTMHMSLGFRGPGPLWHLWDEPPTYATAGNEAEDYGLQDLDTSSRGNNPREGREQGRARLGEHKYESCAPCQSRIS